MADYFISYNKADRSWALAIKAWIEEAGFSTVMQASDFLAGSNFVLEMDSAAKRAVQTIAILSPEYLSAAYTQPEWAAAFAQDPTGNARTLIPVRVRECHPDGLLKQVVYVDLVGLDLAEAEQRLIDALKTGKTGARPAAIPKKKATVPRQRRQPKPTSVTMSASGKEVYQAARDVIINKREIVRPVIAREAHHITEAQAVEILQLLKDLGERDELAGKGRTYGSWQARFKERFEITSYKTLAAADYDDAVSWLKQQKAMGRPALRRTNNDEWRKDYYAVVHSIAKKLGWEKPQLYSFAQDRLGIRKPVESLKDLGERNLAKLAGIMRRESRKR